MNGHKMKLALALILALALLVMPGLAEEVGEAVILFDGDGAEALPEAAGELLPEAPEATEPPGDASKQEAKDGGIPWLTSYNYPKEKVNFENEIWAVLTGKWGLRDYQAAGLMSSIQAESGFCPYNAEGRGGSDDRGHYEYKVGDAVGFGLCQWTSSGRKAALLRHAEAHGSAELVWDFDIQMGFMGGEIDMAALKSTRNLYEAAEWTVMFYERPDQRYENSWPGTRYERGRAIFRAHTGRDYEEPEMVFSARTDDGEAVDGGVALSALDGAGILTVRSGCYWRLEIAGESEPGWLSVEAPDFYHPERMVPCVCGYVCDGDKPLTLTAEKLPPLGQTYRATLRFELYRGDRETLEIPVSVTSTPRDALIRLSRIDYKAAAQATAIALAAGKVWSLERGVWS